MTTYTNVSKPVSTPYANPNVAGRQQYDQSDISYDDASVFYDGVNRSMYTTIPKPADTLIPIRAGTATGLLMSFTYATDRNVGTSLWTKINKPV